MKSPNVSNKFNRVRIHTHGNKNPYHEIYVEADGNKNYVGYTFGMMGEGVIEVGYSSVNGSASAFSPKECIDLLRSAAILFLRSNPTPSCQYERLLMLYNLAFVLDEVYNDWLYGSRS